jgi:hypothetical protein
MYGQNTATATYILKCDLVNVPFKLSYSGGATATVYVGSYVYLLFKLVLECCAGFWRNPFMDGWVSEWLDDSMWDLRFLQHWWGRLKSGGLWCFVTGQIVSIVCGLLDPKMKGLQSFETLAQWQHRIPKDLNLWEDRTYWSGQHCSQRSHTHWSYCNLLTMLCSSDLQPLCQ